MELTTLTYEQWVAEGKPLVQRWKGATLEVCRFLYPKKLQFSRKDNRTSNLERSWSGFLAEIGLSRSTAHNWLSQYDAKNNRMLPPPEPKPQPEKTPEQAAEQRQRIKEAQARFKEDSPKQDTFTAAEDVLLGGVFGGIVEREQKRQTFKEQIRVSQAGETDTFIDALMDYLEELDSDNRRIEACQNIIKVCKNIAVELQQ